MQQHYFRGPSWPTHTHTSPITLETYFGMQNASCHTVIVDPKGRIWYTDDNVDGDNLIAVLEHGVSQEYFNHLQRKGISFLFAWEDGDEMCLAMAILRTEFGVETLRLEDGGMINGTFLKAGLVDELSLLSTLV